MTIRFLLCACCLALAACASEDPSIVNPPPGSAQVIVRLLNLVPDSEQRKLVMEQGYQTGFVAPGRMSATVDAPTDSSLIEIATTSNTELRTSQRVRFSRQSVYDVIATGQANGPDAFDTIVVSNANRTLTTLPVAQVRVINALPDTNFAIEVHVGCPNGSSLSGTPVAYRGVSLYKEVAPGTAVFSIQLISASQSTILGTYECTLEQYTPYSIIVHRMAGVVEPQLMLIKESDFTVSADRPFLPVSVRDASMRLCNLSTSAASATLLNTGQVVASGIPPRTINAYASVPTCEELRADVVELALADGRKAVDSTSLSLRGKYTLVAADSMGAAKLIIVPPCPVVYNVSGKVILRVVHAGSKLEQINVSAGARSDKTNPNGVSSGATFANNIVFGNISNPVVLEPGHFPITVTTGKPPTSILEVGLDAVLPDHYYLLVISETPDGRPKSYLLDELNQSGTLNKLPDAALLRFVNGSPNMESALVSIAQVVDQGRVYYRNSLATSVGFGPTEVTAGGARITANTRDDMRTLVVYAHKGGAESLFEITSEPLRQIPGQSDRRVINATADVELVTVTYDTLYTQYPDSSEAVARDVPFGQTSATHVLLRDRRGSMYVYDATTRKRLYTMPIDLGPLGNSYSLIVVGRKESGYEVIVLQAF
jgi:hypothetical protein